MAARYGEGDGGSSHDRRTARRVNDAVPLKSRLYSAWYRFRYGWQFQSSIPLDKSPVWLLGRCYHAEGPLELSDELGKEGVPPHIVQLMDHYSSLTWMTYRTHFPPISDTLLTTDCGWGCMVRSGQMLLATALHYHLLNRDWRLSTSTERDRTTHAQILSWFADSPQKLCPFSLHSLMRQAEVQGYRPGDWYGPSQIASIMTRCLEIAKNEHPNLRNLSVYLARDCTVYVKDVERLFEVNDGGSLLLLVPIRLGGESLNPIYIPCVQNLLSLDHCIGIIGGKPKHSVYFVGFQDDKLLNLDPHFCQLAASINSSDFDIRSYHCRTPRKLTASKMDPSCTIGFFCHSREEFHVLRRKTEPVLAPPKQKGVYPFFTFADMSMGDVITDSALRQVDISTLGSGSSHQSHNTSDSRSLGADYSDDEFLVVECRTNAAGTLTASLPAPVSPHQVGRDGGSPEDRGSKMQHITLNGSNSTCADNLKT
jgi:cysteine protease ATG4